MRKIRGFIPLIIFGVLMLVFSAPLLLLRRAWYILTRADASARRRSEMAWHFRTARFYHRLLFPLMGITMPITIEGGVPKARPCILVSNHRTAIDHLVLGMVLGELDLNHTFWILKKEMRRAPILGGTFARAGHAFVTRRGDPTDKECIRAMARTAREHGASVALYPEGTRFNGVPRPGAIYRHVLEPKLGGFSIFREELPDYPVVFVCLDWQGLEGRTILDGEGFLDIRGRVKVWTYIPSPGEDAKSILSRGWGRMEELLTHAFYEQTL